MTDAAGEGGGYGNNNEDSGDNEEKQSSFTPARIINVRATLETMIRDATLHPEESEERDLVYFS